MSEEIEISLRQLVDPSKFFFLFNSDIAEGVSQGKLNRIEVSKQISKHAGQHASENKSFSDNVPTDIGVVSNALPFENALFFTTLLTISGLLPHLPLDYRVFCT